jgi:Flp pilus assembly protein TadD
MERIDARIGHRDALLLADLATAWLERGDAGRAVVYARRAYALQPASPVTADIYGLALAKAGQGKAGLEYLEKALALAPGNPLVHAHIRLAQASMKGAKG